MVLSSPLSHAPAITETQVLSEYLGLAETAPARVKEAMVELLKIVRKWWDIPESITKKETHVSGAIVQELDRDSKEALDPLIPEEDILKVYSERFESLSSGAIRNAACHLLWYVVELKLGREPMSLP